MRYNYKIENMWPKGIVIKWNEFCSEFEDTVDTDRFGEWMEKFLPDRKTRYFKVSEDLNGPKWIKKIFIKIYQKYGTCWLEIYY